MNIETAQASIAAARESLALASAALTPDPPAMTTHVLAGQSLQAALDLRLPITTENGVTFPGTYVFPSDTSLVFGAGSGIKGTTAQAVIIKPGTRNVKANGVYETGHPQKILIGAEGADMPSDITFAFYTIPKQVGKRAFDVHGDRVSLTDGEVEYIAGPDQDSQAIYVAAGVDGLIARNVLRAGSEVVLFGGTAARSSTFLTPHNWTVEDNDITRPREVQTDGVADRVKNLVEAKNLDGGIFRRNRIHNNWRDTQGGQSGWAILLTPADDGMASTEPRYSGIVKNILFEDNDIFDVSSGFQILGRNYASITGEPLSGIVIRNNRVRISRALFADGGLGQFLVASAEVGSVDIEDNCILSDGSSFFYSYAGKVMLEGGTLRDPGLKFGHVGFARNILGNLGAYGFNLWGIANAKEAAWQTSVQDYQLTGNVYNGQARTGYLGGTFLPGAEFDALPAVLAVKALA